jgi:hypothetical protein
LPASPTTLPAADGSEADDPGSSDVFGVGELDRRSMPGLPLRLVRRTTGFMLSTDIFWSAEGELRAQPLGGLWRWPVALLMLTTGLAALLGYVVRLRQVSVVEAFVPVYAGMIVLWGFPSVRYLLPLLPLLVLYGVTGLRWLHARGGPAGRRAALAVAVLVTVSYLVNVPRAPRAPYQAGPESAAAAEVFAHIRACTPPDARFATFRPRALTLYTGREATSISLRLIELETRHRNVLDDMGVDHVLTFRESPHERIVSAMPDFVPTFRSEGYAVYRYHAAGADAAYAEAAALSPACEAVGF